MDYSGNLVSLVIGILWGLLKGKDYTWYISVFFPVNCMIILLVVEPTPLKNTSQIGNHPQVEVKIENI